MSFSEGTSQQMPTLRSNQPGVSLAYVCQVVKLKFDIFFAKFHSLHSTQTASINFVFTVDCNTMNGFKESQKIHAFISNYTVHRMKTSKHTKDTGPYFSG